MDRDADTLVRAAPLGGITHWNAKGADLADASKLHGVLHTFVVPDPTISSLLNSNATFANSPNRFMDGRWIVKVEFREFLLYGIGSRLGLVVWNGGIKMVGHMGCTNLMVQKVNQTPRIHLVVGTINGVQGSLDKVVVIQFEMRDICVCVLQPGYHWQQSTADVSQNIVSHDHGNSLAYAVNLPSVKDQPGIDHQQRTAV